MARAHNLKEKNLGLPKFLITILKESPIQSFWVSLCEKFKVGTTLQLTFKALYDPSRRPICLYNEQLSLDNYAVVTLPSLRSKRFCEVRE